MARRLGLSVVALTHMRRGWTGLASGLLLVACGVAPVDVHVHTAVAADVVSVEVSGEPGAYTLAVGVSSPDTGCDQYADWWEVVSEDGELLYRRILTHSHVDEQPFVRSGGPLAIQPDRVVWVRAHMHPRGYGGTSWRGSVDGGFAAEGLASGFAAAVAQQQPLPDGCRF